jgi:hypothetical protein
MLVAPKMLLQLAMQDIGQLTDIEPQRVGKRSPAPPRPVRNGFGVGGGPNRHRLDSPLMTQLDVDEHGRPEPPLAADENDTLLGFLDDQRATLTWKCAGLDAAGLAATVAACLRCGPRPPQDC